MAWIISFLLNRLKEPSTWAGLATIAQVFNWHFSNGDLATTLSAIAAAGAVVMPEASAALKKDTSEVN